MTEKTSTYSRIIGPADYNQIITHEHVFISGADQLIKGLIEKYKPTSRIAEVVEIGCGPARILPLVAQISGISLTGIDHDPAFVEYGKRELADGYLHVNIITADFLTYTHPSPVDIFYSQGVHHHIGKKSDTKNYLERVAAQLTDSGVYILSDEFLPEYKDEHDRKIKAVIWYCFVIARALPANHEYLAQEEAKTLIDDLYESDGGDATKNESQIKLVLDSCQGIEAATREKNMAEVEKVAEELLSGLEKHEGNEKTGDTTVDLSRGDYKICDSVLRSEIEQVGLVVLERQTVGPVGTIGGMSVYVLKKK